MGEPKEVWDERVQLLLPYQVNREAMEKTGNPRTKFMHCLPAFHDENTAVGAEIMERTGIKGGLEVSDEVFESPAEHRLRPGREPAPHDQGRSRRDARLSGDRALAPRVVGYVRVTA